MSVELDVKAYVIVCIKLHSLRKSSLILLISAKYSSF